MTVRLSPFEFKINCHYTKQVSIFPCLLLQNVLTFFFVLLFYREWHKFQLNKKSDPKICCDYSWRLSLNIVLVLLNIKKNVPDFIKGICRLQPGPSYPNKQSNLISFLFTLSSKDQYTSKYEKKLHFIIQNYIEKCNLFKDYIDSIETQKEIFILSKIKVIKNHRVLDYTNYSQGKLLYLSWQRLLY